MAEYIRLNYPHIKIILEVTAQSFLTLTLLCPMMKCCRGEGVKWLRTYFGDNPAMALSFFILYLKILFTAIYTECRQNQGDL